MDQKNQQDPLQTLLSQFDNADPQMRQMLEMQLRNNQNKKSEPSKEEVIRRFKIQNKKLLEHIAGLKETLKTSRQEHQAMVGYLDYFLKLNNALAAALGSCENCWGEDASCEKCGGDGISGWTTVNRRLFNLYVQPCIDKLNLSNQASKPK